MIGMFIHQQSIDTDSGGATTIPVADGSININNNNDDNSDVGDNHSGSNVDDDSAHLIIDQILAMKEDSDAMACDYKRSLYRYIQNNNIDTNDLINGVGISGRSYLAVRTY